MIFSNTFLRHFEIKITKFYTNFDLLINYKIKLFFFPEINIQKSNDRSKETKSTQFQLKANSKNPQEIPSCVFKQYFDDESSQ